MQIGDIFDKYLFPFVQQLMDRGRSSPKGSARQSNLYLSIVRMARHAFANFNFLNL